MKKVLFACLIIAISAVSCKKSGSGSGTGSKFMSFTPGSVWNYQTTNNTAVPPTTNDYTLTSTTKDTTINSKSYHVFTNTSSNGSMNEYYNITGNDYYQYSVLIDQLPAIDLNYLNDAKDVGSSWSQTIQFPIPNSPVPGLALTATIKNTILAKGTSIEVNGTNYTGVYKVKSDITIAPLPIPGINLTTSSDINNYYSPKFGMIKRDFILNIKNGATDVINTNTTTILKSATIL